MPQTEEALLPMFFIRCGLLAVMFSAYCLSVLFYLKNKIATEGIFKKQKENQLL